jgi:hypothetical protein
MCWICTGRGQLGVNSIQVVSRWPVDGSVVTVFPLLGKAIPRGLSVARPCWEGADVPYICFGIPPVHPLGVQHGDMPLPPSTVPQCALGGGPISIPPAQPTRQGQSSGAANSTLPNVSCNLLNSCARTKPVQRCQRLAPEPVLSRVCVQLDVHAL